MKIIIIGCGSVGNAICEQLGKDGHDITIIDNDLKAIYEMTNLADVFGVEGNGADVSVLRKAGAEKADLLIAATAGDELNILACAAAHRLGTKHTIARVRNPEYTELMRLMREDINLSMTINPELTVAKEIYRQLRFPAAVKIDTFARGRVELAEFEVPEDSPICGATLYTLRSNFKMNFLVCAVSRGGEIIIPSGDFKIWPGDIIGVTVSEEEMPDFFKAIGAYKKPVREVLITGAGTITYYLEKMMKKGKIRSTVIDRDKTLCKELADSCDCTVICDDGSRQDLLIEEGVDRADAFLALTGDDEENAVASLFAKAHGAKKTVTLISALSYDVFFKSLGIESIVSQKNATASAILRYIRSIESRDTTEVESLHRFMDERVEAIEFHLTGEIGDITGIPLKEMHIRHGVLIACIVRNDILILPTGMDTIEPDDNVIVIAGNGAVRSIRDILS